MVWVKQHAAKLAGAYSNSTNTWSDICSDAFTTGAVKLMITARFKATMSLLAAGEVRLVLDAGTGSEVEIGATDCPAGTTRDCFVEFYQLPASGPRTVSLQGRRITGGATLSIDAGDATLRVEEATS